MNANVNIMSATSSSTSAAPVKAAQSPIRESAKASASGQQDTKDSSFSNVLDKTQQDKVSPDKPEQDKPEAKDALEGAKDPLSQAIAAAVVQQNGAKQTGDTKAAASENPVTDSLAARVLADGQGKAQLTSAAMALSGGAATAVDQALQAASQSTAVETTGASLVQPAAIEALLQPASAGAANTADKSQQLLNLLTGAQQNAVSAPQAGAQVLQQSNMMMQQAGAQDNAAAVETAVPAIANMASAETKGTQDSQTAQTPAAKGISGLWGNAVLSVESQGNMQQQLSGGMQQDAHSAAQQGQANAQSMVEAPAQPALTIQTTAMPQLPEEAQFDTASAKSDSTADAMGPQTSQVLFQQTLQDASGAQSADASQAASQPQTDYDIPKQIVDQARLIKSTEDTQMVIKLKPEHLGELTLKVSVTANGSVNASFHSDNAQVRAAIESSMVQLRQELQAQGIRVDHVDVYAGLGDGSLGSSQQQYQQSQQGGNALRSQQVDQAAFEEEAEGFTPIAAADSTAGTASDSGVDYRI